MRSFNISLLATALVGAVLFANLEGNADASAQSKPEEAVAIVSVAPAIRTEFAPRHWAPGSVVSRQDSRIAGEVEGRVVRIAEVGDTVRAGEPIAVLDDTGLRLEERDGQAATSRVAAQLQLAQAQERRYAALASQQTIAQAHYEQQRADRDVLAQDLASARARLAQTRHQRTRMIVRAPFDGIVAERLVQPGEYLQPGDPVARLVDTALREVRVHAPVELARHVPVGADVLIRAQVDGGAERTARVTALVPVGDEASRQIELRVAVDQQSLPVGSAVTVGLPSARPRSVVAVPRDALVLRREGNFVVRIDAGNRAERLAVEAGEEIDGLIEVQGAVAPGDRLVVRGAERVEPGQPLSVQPVVDTVAAR